MKHLVLVAALLLSFTSISFTQTEPPPIDSLDAGETPETLFNDILIFQSPTRIIAEASSAIRFDSNADVYLRWLEIPTATGYTLRYRFDAPATTWTTAQISTNEILLEGLPLDTLVIWEVIPIGTGEDDNWISDVSRVSTWSQDEPVIVSEGLYNRLEAWFAKEGNEEAFCEFIDELTTVSLYEKLAFLQAYAFDNASFIKPSTSTGSSLQPWFPSNSIFGSGEDQWCIPIIVGSCKCKVVSKGSNLATPNENMNNYHVEAKKFSKDGSEGNEYRLEAGAAKFSSLKQNRGVFSNPRKLIRSNLPVSEDPESVTTEASELAFFLACLSGSGNYNTNIPSECDCTRPLHVYYQYTSRLRILSKVRSCWVSKGSEATAEDWAWIGALQGKTGDITPIAAGRATLNSSCKSSWNPDFWIKLLDLAGPALQYYVQTLDSTSGSNIPTNNQINQFISGLQALITTPFSIKNSNGCLDETRDAALLTGSRTFSLAPNAPIRVTLFSAYYLRTRGYGCWRSEAGVASDYYLLGVVESAADPINEECCAKKYANYIVGSQSGPDGTNTFPLSAVNSLANRLGGVGFFLSLFGSWDNLPTVPGSGVIVLTREFDNEIRGVSCINGGENFERPVKGRSVATQVVKFAVFPSKTSDWLNVQVNAETETNLQIRLFDVNGHLAKVAYSGDVSPGGHLLQLSIGDLPQGAYIVHCTGGSQAQNFKILVF